MNLQKTIVIIFVCAVCMSGPLEATKKDLAYYPQQSSMIYFINLEYALKSGFFEMIGEEPPELNIKKFTQITGLDEQKDISTVSVAVLEPKEGNSENENEDTEKEKAEKSSFMVLRGNFDSDEITEHIEEYTADTDSNNDSEDPHKNENITFTTESYLKKDVVILKQAGKEYAFCIFRRNVMLTGKPDSVKKMISIAERKEPFAGNNRQILKVVPAAGKNTLFWTIAAGLEPDELKIPDLNDGRGRGRRGRGGGTGNPMEMLTGRGIQAIFTSNCYSISVEVSLITRLELGKKKKYIAIVIKQYTKDKNKANEVVSFLQQVRSYLDSAAPFLRENPRVSAVVPLFKNLKTSLSGRVLKIQLTIPVEDIENIKKIFPALSSKHLEQEIYGNGKEVPRLEEGAEF